MKRRLLVLAAVLAGVFNESAQADTHINVNVDLRNDRPLITRFRRVRRFGWHSGLHYGPYIDFYRRSHVGWHDANHLDWYTIDVPLLSKIDESDWEVFIRLGKDKSLRVRGDLDREVRTKTVISAPGGAVLRWVAPDGTVISGGPATTFRKRFVGNGWEGFDIGNSIIIMDLPGSPGVEVYLKQKTKDLGPAETQEPPADAAARREKLEKQIERDKLLDEGDQRFARALYPQAALLYQKAMKLDETDAIARFAVAHCLFALDLYNTAGQNVRLALDGFPDWPQVDLRLQKFYTNEAMFFDKLKALERYAAERPDDADSRLLLGYCHHFSGSREKAAAEFEKLAAEPGGDKQAELFLNLLKREDGAEK